MQSNRQETHNGHHDVIDWHGHCLKQMFMYKQGCKVKIQMWSMIMQLAVSSWKKKYVLAEKGAKRCFWLAWMSILKISRKYRAVMSVESFENGLFCQKQAKNDQNSPKWPFFRCSTGITAQYFLLIFDMLLQVNQKHLLAPIPASTYFFSHVAS